jgi:hypothetical protein
MTKYAEAIGMKMAFICPDILLKINAVSEENTENEKKAESKSAEGEIVDIKIEQFATIIVKDKNGRNQNCMVLNYFDTASLFINGDIKKGIKVILTYEERELYDALSKDFRYFKVITKIEKN